MHTPEMDDVRMQLSMLPWDQNARSLMDNWLKNEELTDKMFDLKGKKRLTITRQDDIDLLVETGHEAAFRKRDIPEAVSDQHDKISWNGSSWMQKKILDIGIGTNHLDRHLGYLNPIDLSNTHLGRS
jgi:hypothetical protein